MLNFLNKKGAFMMYGFLICILYLPHFFYLKGVPQILNDSYAYFLLANDLYEGNYPLQGHLFDLPLGYSIFMTTIYKLGGNMQTVVIVQTLIFVSSFIPLIYFFNKRSFKMGCTAALLCFLYMSTSESLLWSSLLYTESLYISSLAIFVFGLLFYFEESKPKYVIICCGAILLACLFRSNGIFLFAILFLLMILKLLTKKRKDFFVLFRGAIAIVMISCSINFICKDHLLPFETKRLSEMLGFTSNAYDITLKKGSVDLYAGSFGGQAWKLLINASKAKFGNHYYYRMPQQLSSFLGDGIEKQVMEGPIPNMYKETSLEEKRRLISFIKKDVSFSQLEREYIFNITNVEKRPRNAWVYACHLIHLGSPIFRNPVVMFVFWICFFVVLVKAIKNKFNLQNGSTQVLILSLVHVVSICLLITIVPRDTSLSRYAITTEFIVILLPLYIFYKNKSKTLNT